MENMKETMKSQVQRIIDALSDGKWHCTSEFYGDFMADPRRRMIDIKERGFYLHSRKCQRHPYHSGGSKEWIMGKESLPKKQVVEFVETSEGRRAIVRYV